MMCNCSQCNTSEGETNFQMDVYYYMKENSCDEKTAIKAIEPLYRKEDGE